MLPSVTEARSLCWGRLGSRLGSKVEVNIPLRDVRANLNSSVRWRSLAGGVKQIGADAEGARQAEESQYHAVQEPVWE
jgi:hypothetical protein